ncbi:MAG: HD domain-containing protein [Clostridia bacterium]|nr:MAG: HD domain-containing protein [Clostridia bacterium]
MPRVSVERLKAGSEVTSIFLVKAKYLRSFKERKGEYLTIVLGDSTGQIVAKVWEKALETDGICSPGDVVAVTGSVTEYKGALEIHLTSLRVLAEGEFDPREFLPASPREVHEMFTRLQELMQEITNPHLKKLLDHLFADQERVRAFITAPAAKANHQAYLGGLLEHTLNVATMAGEAARTYPQVDKDLLLSGAILHDLGKTGAYNYTRVIDTSDQGRLLGHIVLGVLDLEQEMAGIPGFPVGLRLKLLHMVASHHGRYEWQSPVRPQFLEAAILHHLDMLDADIDMFTTAQGKGKREGLRWSYNKTLEQYIWTAPPGAREDGPEHEGL